MARSLALRRVSCNVKKITFFLTLRACVRWRYGCNKKTTFATFPVGLTAFRADIPCEFTFSSVTTVGTHKFIRFVFHPLLPPVSLVSDFLLSPGYLSDLQIIFFKKRYAFTSPEFRVSLPIKSPFYERIIIMRVIILLYSVLEVFDYD